MLFFSHYSHDFFFLINREKKKKRKKKKTRNCLLVENKKGILQCDFGSILRLKNICTDVISYLAFVFYGIGYLQSGFHFLGAKNHITPILHVHYLLSGKALDLCKQDGQRSPRPCL